MAKIKKVKMKKREIKRDKFVEFVLDMYRDVENNWKKYSIIAVILVLVIISIGYYTNNIKQNNLKASTQLYIAVEMFYAGDYGGALEYFDTVKKNYYGTQSAKMAEYYLGVANLHIQKIDDALRHYKTYLKSKSNDILAANAYIGIAKAFEMKGEVDSAIVYYENLVKKYPGSHMINEANLSLGRLYEMRMEFDKAIKYYNKVYYSVQSQAYSNKSREYRNMLEGAIIVMNQMIQQGETFE